VDDDPEIRDFFKDTSAALGIRCEVAASGEEAVEIIAKENPFNVFFIDWKLPGINGIELVRKIHEKSKQKPIVVLFSSADWNTIKDEARAAGIDKFLPKPLFRSSIVDTINECIGVDHAEEQKKKSEDVDDFSDYFILLAEDIEINREIVISLLDGTGIVIETAVNGREALKMVEDKPDKFDLILMDVQMPLMDGLEATKQIRGLAGDTAKRLPIIAMTANVFKEDIDECIAAGMDDHIGKPLDMDELFLKLRKYMGTN
jgi:CheY-like chemotaxis protein